MPVFSNYMSNNGPFFFIKNFGCTQHSSSKLDSVFVCTKFPLFLNFISARNARTAVIVVLYIHRHSFCMCERPILSQIPLIIADKPQNNKTALTSPNCLSLRYNAACCIPLRYLRYLRENTRKRTQTIRTEETPVSPADHADLRRRNPKQH